jgi:hypothetical protein
MVKRFVVVEMEHGFVVAVHGDFTSRDLATIWAQYHVKKPAHWIVRGLDYPEITV